RTGGARARRDVEIRRRDVDQEVADTAADEVRLVDALDEAAHDFGCIRIDPLFEIDRIDCGLGAAAARLWRALGTSAGRPFRDTAEVVLLSGALRVRLARAR